tara:strand:- start:145 stop:1644 length:1500 start_codon:yes stop_codon:yes gene_type:complete
METNIIPPQIKEKNSEQLLEKIRNDFLGLNTEYNIANGEKTKRIYLDSTASTLMMGIAYRTSEKFLKHYSNTHSLMHFSAKIATKTYAWVHERMLEFVHADPEHYTCFFTGSGTTSGMNRIARIFNHLQPKKDIVLVSIMEHHSNDLPHRKHGGHVIHIPVDTHESKMGCVDMDLLEHYLREYEGRVNYVSITGISNVTGIINPINEVAKLAHHYGAYIVVDAAQMAAHVPIHMCGHDDPEMDIDALIFSGHKTYAPGSPGVVITRKDLISKIEPEEVGGGMVERVLPEKYYVKNDFPDREEAGTPNILGAITLGAAIHVLDQIGMDTILREDTQLTQYCMEEMLKIPELVIYGCTENCPRAGTISFNIKQLNHGLVAAILNDYFNIAVRNECFCAHPYVEKMLELTHRIQIYEARAKNISSWHTEPWMGMVRVSFGIYNTQLDVDHFIHALKDIISKIDQYSEHYKINSNGDYEHKTFQFSCNEYFSLSNNVQNELQT